MVYLDLSAPLEVCKLFKKFILPGALRHGVTFCQNDEKIKNIYLEAGAEGTVQELCKLYVKMYYFSEIN